MVQGAVDVDIGANPSAEGAEEDEGVDDQAAKVVDIVDTFRLQVTTYYFVNITYLLPFHGHHIHKFDLVNLLLFLL